MTEKDTKNMLNAMSEKYPQLMPPKQVAYEILEGEHDHNLMEACDQHKKCLGNCDECEK